MECFLDDFRAFGINTDQWTTAAQDEGGWCRTAEQGAEHFIAKWIAAEKAEAGLRHSVIYPNITETAKERIAQSKRARAGLLALVDYPQVARTCILWAFGLQIDAITSFSGVTFVLFCVALLRFSSLCFR